MKRSSFSLSHVLLMVLTAGLLVAGAHVFAQSKATAYIPFSFLANQQMLPSGHYSLELVSDRFLCFSNSRTGEYLTVIMVQPEPGNYIETRGQLWFVASPGQHYLTEVRFAGSNIRSRPIVSRSLERELARNPQPNSSIEIAMR